jgi:hypothetical protein
MDEMDFVEYPVAMRTVRGVLPPDTVQVWPDLNGRLLYRGNGIDIPSVALVGAESLRSWLVEAKYKQAMMLAFKTDRERCRA